MKIKTNEMEGAALDWAVAKCEGIDLFETEGWSYEEDTGTRKPYRPSTDWAQGGHIIEREGITVELLRRHEGGADLWEGRIYAGYPNKKATQNAWVTATASTPLIAAMRCYVESKLGDAVEIPEELK